MPQLRRRASWALGWWIAANLTGITAQNAQALSQPPKAHPPKVQVKPAIPTEDPAYTAEKQRTNAGTVSIMVSGLNCTCMQFAEDIRNVVKDLRPNGYRALIAIGEGGPQHLKDMNFLPGVHMAIVDEADLKRLETSDPEVFANAREKFRFITKLYNAEFHILARNEINSVADLRGKAVNVEHAGSQSDNVAARVFGVLGVNYTATHDDEALAREKLLHGELAAIVLSTGAPQDSLRQFKQGDGVHFLALDETSLPDHDLKPIQTEFLPAELTSDDYPDLIAAGDSVSTIASRMVLAIYNWPEKGEHYNRNALFTAAFFSKIDQFHDPSRHPKWREVNIAAEVPGWTRFKPAQDWLDRDRETSASLRPPASRSAGERAAFERFIKGRAAEGAPIDPNGIDTLYKEFEAFMAFREKSRAESSNAAKAGSNSNAAPKPEH